MKAKFLAVLTAAALAMSILAGCGTGSSDTKDSDTAAETTEETTEEINVTPVSEEEAEKAGFSDGTELSESGDTDAAESGTEDSSAEDESAEDSADADAESESTGTEISASEDTVTLDTSSELTGIHHAVISIKDYGEIQLELDADTAPITVTNFVKLVQDGFYDGLTFWRIMDGFMIQGGDPLGNGTGGSDETIKGEFSNNGVENNISHVRGTISMARSTDPDSASSQFFIVQSDSTFLDGDYAAFGKVTEGMDVVDQICKDAEPTDDNGTIEKDKQPVIESIQIVD